MYYQMWFRPYFYVMEWMNQSIFSLDIFTSLFSAEWLIWALACTELRFVCENINRRTGSLQLIINIRVGPLLEVCSWNQVGRNVNERASEILKQFSKLPRFWRYHVIPPAGSSLPHKANESCHAISIIFTTYLLRYSIMRYYQWSGETHLVPLSFSRVYGWLY
jgi:hypothetical protein